MIKLYQQPHFEEAQSGRMGIYQVVKNLTPYLMQAFTLVDDPTQADVIVSHAGAFKLNPQPHQVFIAVNHGLNWTGMLKMDDFAYQENHAVPCTLR